MTLATRVPEPIRDRVEQISASEGLSRSAWLARVVIRAVESYPLDDLYLRELERAEERLRAADEPGPEGGRGEVS